jgi:hypothetical protein
LTALVAVCVKVGGDALDDIGTAAVAFWRGRDAACEVTSAALMPMTKIKRLNPFGIHGLPEPQ